MRSHHPKRQPDDVRYPKRWGKRKPLSPDGSRAGENQTSLLEMFGTIKLNSELDILLSLQADSGVDGIPGPCRSDI